MPDNLEFEIKTLQPPMPEEVRRRLSIYGRCEMCHSVRYGVRGTRATEAFGDRVYITNHFRLGCPNCSPVQPEKGEEVVV